MIKEKLQQSNWARATMFFIVIAATAAAGGSACLSGCATKNSATSSANDARRADLLGIREDTLTQLYRARENARPEIEQAPGYAVFSNKQAPGTVGGGAEGYGVVINNATSLPTYMKMEQTAPPDGKAVELAEYRVVFVFPDAATMQTFSQNGWKFGTPGSAPPAGKPLKIYRLTHDGVEVTNAVPSTRYWPYKELN
jgi:hypothetical protein